MKIAEKLIVQYHNGIHYVDVPGTPSIDYAAMGPSMYYINLKSVLKPEDAIAAYELISFFETAHKLKREFGLIVKRRILTTTFSNVIITGVDSTYEQTQDPVEVLEIHLYMYFFTNTEPTICFTDNPAVRGGS